MTALHALSLREAAARVRRREVSATELVRDAFARIAAVDGRKQARVARVARYFLAERRWHERDARFDVIGVRFDREPPAVEHVRAAFEVGG